MRYRALPKPDPLPFSAYASDLEALLETLRTELKLDDVALTIVTADAEIDGIDDLIANVPAPIKVEEMIFVFGKDKLDLLDRLRVSRHSIYASGANASRAEQAVKDFLMRCRRNRHPWRGAVAAFVFVVLLIDILPSVVYHLGKGDLGAEHLRPGWSALFALPFLWSGWGFANLLSNKIIPKRREAKFFARNRNTIVVGIIVGTVMAIIGGFIGAAIKAATGG